MVANLHHQRLTTVVLPVVALAAAVALSIAVAAAPAATFEAATGRLGIERWPGADAGPGVLARTVIALAAGALVAAFGLLPGVVARLRPLRADAHPDAPLRRPISANEELGSPLPAPRAPLERALPADLDLPLAAFDPDALPATPREPVRAVAALARLGTRPTLIDPGERFDTFELTPPAQQDHHGDQPPLTIGALLARLERSACATTQPEPARNLEDTLSALRRLATG